MIGTLERLERNQREMAQILKKDWRGIRGRLDTY